MRRIHVLILLIIFVLPFEVGAAGVFEGSWHNEDPTGDGVSSVSIFRYGDTYVGNIQAGSRRGRLYFSKLKGWIEDEKLFARVCDERDDGTNDDELNECLEKSPVSNYFAMRGTNLVWFKKELAGWREAIVLQPARRAVKASRE
jgi:hypothetical protein